MRKLFPMACLGSRAPKYKRDLKKSPKTDFKRPFLNNKKDKKKTKKEDFLENCSFRILIESTVSLLFHGLFCVRVRGYMKYINIYKYSRLYICNIS